MTPSTDSIPPAERRIRLLPIHVANKIAAGEVVERPSSVVKELVENSIDAGARRIDVVVTAGGRKLVSVADDGRGMDRDDALMSVERQATSKIADVDDIESIATLGFRGEALASIASVSRFVVKTCRRGQDVGTEVIVTGGRMQDVRDVGVPAGSTIEVRDLFFNVPARRKFLRAYQTEQSHIRNTFMVAALAHPEIAMNLRADGHDLYVLPPCETLEERVRDIYGAEYLAHLKGVDGGCHGVRVTGFVGLPNWTRADSHEQFFFINGRPATAPILQYALREAYPPIDKGRKPVLFLMLRLDPGEVDVNVHPTKREVRFRKPSEVRDAVIGAVAAALGTATPERVAASPSATAAPPLPAPTSAVIPRRDPVQHLPLVSGWEQSRPPYPHLHPLTGEGTEPRSREAPSGSAPECIAAQAEASDAATEGAPAPLSGEVSDADALPAVTPAPVAGSSPWAWSRVLGQVANRYVLLETDGGYVVLDPRAAHERVLFERLMRQVHEGHVASQALLLPETVTLPPRDAARVREQLELFHEMGFGLDEFGGDAFVLDALPDCLGGVDGRRLLLDISHGLEVAGARRGKGRWREEAIGRSACLSAVSSRQKLSEHEIERLVADLARTEMPYTCPRGRPTMLFTPLRELARKFGRE